MSVSVGGQTDSKSWSISGGGGVNGGTQGICAIKSDLQTKLRDKLKKDCETATNLVYAGGPKCGFNPL